MLKPLPDPVTIIVIGIGLGLFAWVVWGLFITTCKLAAIVYFRHLEKKLGRPVTKKDVDEIADKIEQSINSRWS